jgi:hypothetical protein
MPVLFASRSDGTVNGWAGFADYYHAFCMSWTAYWMLRWAVDLTPGRKDEVLAFTRPYADFLVKQQLASGVISVVVRPRPGAA